MQKKFNGTESWLTSSFTEPSHSAPTCLTGNVSKNTLNLKYIIKNDLLERNLFKMFKLIFSAKEINPSQRRVSAWSPKHSIGSLLGMEVKPDSFYESQSKILSHKPNITFWSSVVAGSIEPDICFISQW